MSPLVLHHASPPATVGRCAPTPARNPPRGGWGGVDHALPMTGTTYNSPPRVSPSNTVVCRGYTHLRTQVFFQEVPTGWRMCSSRQRKPAGSAPGQAVQVGTQAPSASSAASHTLGSEVSPLTLEGSAGRGTPGPNGGRRDLGRWTVQKVGGKSRRHRAPSQFG